ncbi:MAG: phosphotransferase [Chloroflexi bacterium]|nr:phosphotransferase [Chloroflexota bacterium]
MSKSERVLSARNAAGQMGAVIPAGPEQVTDAWLTAVLRRAGVLDGARVAAHTNDLLEFQGAAGVVARFGLSYDGVTTAAPRSLVAKFASPYEPIRALMHTFGGYAREIEFYRQFGADPGIPVPHCFHAEIDSASGVFVLLLEDMSDARVAADVAMPSVDDIELAVRHLAPFHAKWWGNVRLRELEFLRYPGSAADRLFTSWAPGVMGAALPAARQRYGGALPPIVLEVAERVMGNFAQLTEGRWERVADGSVTLVHGDFHPGQLFFPSERGGRFAVFDWQTVSAGSGTDDLARVIVTGLPPEQRRTCDERLIELYHALLLEHGVTNYDLERCREGFRQGLVTTAIMNIIASVNIDPTRIEEFSLIRDVSMTDAMFGWVADAMEAHNVLEMVSV